MQPSSAANRALAGRATLHAAFSQPPPPDLPGPALPDSRRPAAAAIAVTVDSRARFLVGWLTRTDGDTDPRPRAARV